MQLGERKQQTWDGSFTFRKRQSGLGGWFLVIGNLRLWAKACIDCGCPILFGPFTHFTAGKISEARKLRSWIEENEVETRQGPHCSKCWPDVEYSSYSPSGIWEICTVYEEVVPYTDGLNSWVRSRRKSIVQLKGENDGQTSDIDFS